MSAKSPIATATKDGSKIMFYWFDRDDQETTRKMNRSPRTVLLPA